MPYSFQIELVLYLLPYSPYSFQILLINYLLATNQYRDFVIEKTIRPDFLLRKGDVCIGVEITELTTQTLKVLGQINRKYNNSEFNCEEVKRLAIKEHGKKAEEYEYYAYGMV